MLYVIVKSTFVSVFQLRGLMAQTQREPASSYWWRYWTNVHEASECIIYLKDRQT